MNDSQWLSGFYEAFQGLAHSLYFLKSVINGILNIFNEFPILTIFLGVCVFITVLFFGVDFFINFVNDFDYNVEGLASKSVSFKRYQERQAEREYKNEKRYQERKKEAEDRYQKRKKEREEEYKKRQAERYPNNELNPEQIYQNYFAENPNKISFSYGGKTYYNNDYLKQFIQPSGFKYNPKKHGTIIQRNGNNVYYAIYDKSTGEILQQQLFENV